MSERFIPRNEPGSGPQRRWQRGEIEQLTDREIDKLLAEHWGYDHKGVKRQCTQEIHFCIDDYGPIVAPNEPMPPTRRPR